jgi:enamine deaminase RidA (YjgF/YER057c/UK114 family)
MDAFETQLAALGLTLPAPPKPVATYVPCVQAGDLLFLSGMLPFRDGSLIMEGKLGRELTVEQGYEAAQMALLNALAVIRSHLGTLGKIRQVVRLVGFVASAEGFVQQPTVINGASDLLAKIFGSAGRHARAAVGVAELPLNAPVEIELIVQVLGTADST